MTWWMHTLKHYCTRIAHKKLKTIDNTGLVNKYMAGSTPAVSTKNPECDSIRDFYFIKVLLSAWHGCRESVFAAKKKPFLRVFTCKATESLVKPFRHKISSLDTNDYRLPFSTFLTELRLFGEMKVPGAVCRAGDLIKAIQTEFCHLSSPLFHDIKYALQMQCILSKNGDID